MHPTLVILTLSLFILHSQALSQRHATSRSFQALHHQCCPDTLSDDLLAHIHRCGSTTYREIEEYQNPEIKKARELLEKETNEWIRSRTSIQLKNAQILTIPVVVHVVYHHEKPEQNISDAQIYSQIEALNRDFRRRNTDTINTPLIFRNLAADGMIEFKLARRTPDGKPTNGITRTPTQVEVFSLEKDDVKADRKGGKNIWSRDRYLNLWVCDLESTFLGYAQYPGGFSATDGVVVSYKNFGTIGSVLYPYNEGRTVTHEVGHWLNLVHIWGDEDNCSATDFVSDTPFQETSYYRCPSYPQSSCGSIDMFMNYMDYTDDRCMNLFTEGQKNRMQATLNGFRASLKNSDAFNDPILTQLWCDTLNKTLTGQQFYLYSANEGGYATGTNIYNDKAKAQYFKNNFRYDILDGGAIAFGRVNDGGGKAYAAVWRTGNDGKPSGIPVAQQEISLSDIANDVAKNRFTHFSFNPPVTVDGPFFMGVILPGNQQDTLAILATASIPNVESWELWNNNTWHNFSETWEGSVNANLAIFPKICTYGFPPGRQVNTTLLTGPNPVMDDYINLYFSEITAGKLINIEIFDIMGRRILLYENINLQPRIKIDLNGLNISGIYLIHVSGDGIKLREKFLYFGDHKK